MNSILLFLKKVKEKFKAEVFDFFYKRRKKKRNRNLINKTPSIISYDCTGAYIYHDLGLMFRSPTVNLRFGSYDNFFTFVNHLDYYCSLEIEEIKATDRVSDEVNTLDYRDDVRYTYPLGVIHGEFGDVVLMFVHYTEFDTAVNKWKERVKRIDHDNLFIVMHARYWNDDMVSRFKALNYPDKLMLAYSCPQDDDCVYCYKFTKEFVDSLPFTYMGWFGKRNMDEYDFSAFLDRGTSS